MKNSCVDAMYRKMHPAIGNIGILYWHEICSGSETAPLYIWGDQNSCELFVQRFENNGVSYAGVVTQDQKLSFQFTEDAKVVVALRQFPGDRKLYSSVIRQLNHLGVHIPYTIHEFSSGFPLGSERLISDRESIENAYSILEDDVSRNCYLHFLKKCTTPYYWNMDFSEESFGIPNPRMGSMREDEFWDSSLSEVTCDDYVFFCMLNEFHAHDPNLQLLLTHDRCVVFCPDTLARMRLREWLLKRGHSLEIPIIDSALWDYPGSDSYWRTQWSGGTPIAYPPQEKKIRTDAVDRTVSMIQEGKLKLLLLSMEDLYERALTGAKKTIASHATVIMVNGFHRADLLWSAINDLHQAFPEQQLLLRQYQTENILEGFYIILKTKEK